MFGRENQGGEGAQNSDQTVTTPDTGSPVVKDETVGHHCKNAGGAEKVLRDVVAQVRRPPTPNPRIQIGNAKIFPVMP